MTLYIYEYSTDDCSLDYNFIVAKNREDAEAQATKELEEMTGQSPLDENAVGIDELYPLYEVAGYKLELIKKDNEPITDKDVIRDEDGDETEMHDNHFEVIGFDDNEAVKEAILKQV